MPIPEAKPPVFTLPYRNLGQPEEVNEFHQVMRDILHQAPIRQQ